MRKLHPGSALLILTILAWYGCKTYKPIRLPEKTDKPVFYPAYREDQLLIVYKNPGNAQQQAGTIREAIAKAGAAVDTGAIKVRRCNDCDPYVELWEGDNIHTVISGEGIIAGSGGKTKGVGEDSIAYYSANFLNAIPVNQREGDIKLDPPGKRQVVDGSGKDTILIAILDTGIDTVNWVQNVNLWQNPNEKKDNADEDSNCYKDDVNGWNFIDGNNVIDDDNPTIHGSLISQYIINEFQKSPKNFVQLMVLKTHDKNGMGDLFSSLCAINYAANHGAKIINASWGFYYYYDEPNRSMSEIITNSLAAKGILFITASGNQTPASDLEAQQIYQMQNPGATLPQQILRNLEYHSFYPAVLSDVGSNVITVATSDMNKVSSTQNFSEKFVDLGVLGDTVLPSGAMKFHSPFTAGSSGMVSGSSFATAIATGRIGAFMSKADFVPGITKAACIIKLSTVVDAGGAPVIQSSNPLGTNGWIKDGKFTRRGP